MTGDEAPEFDGLCAFAVSVGPASKAPAGKPSVSLVRDGKTYLFSGVVPKVLFQLIPGSARRAQQHWAAK